MPPPRFPREPVLDDLQIAPPYTDLYVSDIVTKPDHDLQRLNACAVIANHGQAPPSGPMLVHTVVLAEVYVPDLGDWSQELTQEWQWWHAGQALPFRTFWMWAPLHYVEEDGGSYQVIVTVGDPENLPGDRNTNNNYKMLQCPPFIKPLNFTPEMEQPLRQETRIKNGKLTSTLTIGGKPLKKK
jgi:hypothetical protein